MLKYVWMTIGLLLLSSTLVVADQKVISVYTTNPPVMDGVADDAEWASSPIIVTEDKVADIPVEIQSAYTDTSLFIKVRFPDNTENRMHKMLVWNKDTMVYRTGSLREDSFVLKWNMEPAPVNLSLQSGTEYRADIWFWKAFRTDPVGYADDKMHIYSSTKGEGSQNIILTNGEIMFLSRPSDEGKSTYKSIAYEEFIRDTVPRYSHRQPKGSRADVTAKGLWSDGFWTVEFKRELITNNFDDVQFKTDFPVFFGVSRYEIGGKLPNPKLEQPKYESGDITEMLELVFNKE